jgi:tRNA A37 threonylcarbamoyladenosine synthetase subunit TsaC/SUA5/YrdC
MTIVWRVPASPVVQGLLEALGEPLLCASLVLPGDEDPLHEADEILERLARRIELVLDAGGQPFEPTTVIDMTDDEPVVTRVGRGAVEGMTGRR